MQWLRKIFNILYRIIIHMAIKSNTVMVYGVPIVYIVMVIILIICILYLYYGIKKR